MWMLAFSHRASHVEFLVCAVA